MFTRWSSALGLLLCAFDASAFDVSLEGDADVEVRRIDAQLGREIEVRGVPLLERIEAVRPSPYLDLALLHFAGGMLVPLPFRDAAAMRRLDPFIARAVRDGGGWTREFPPVSGEIGDPPERCTVRISGRKLVVQEKWHPYLPDKALATFSPWSCAGALERVELVNRRDYERHLTPAGPVEVASGAKLFFTYCQYCHGVHKQGASAALDLVDALSLEHYQSKNRLFYHIAAFERPSVRRIQMPAVQFVSREESNLVWQWLQAVARRPPENRARRKDGTEIRAGDGGK